MRTNFGLLNTAVYEGEAGGASGTGAGGASGTGAGGASGTGAVSSPADPWASADAETKGYLQNRGWDKLDPVTVAINASKAHREAEKYIGAPANEIIRLPKDINSPDWKGIWEKLGAPADGKYDLTGVKRADGSALDPAFADNFAKTAADLHLPKDAVPEIAKTVTAYLDQTKAAEDLARTEKNGIEKAALAKEWGPNFDANKFVAGQAAQKLGIAPEAIAALEGQIGYQAVMKMFHTIGTKIGEDRYIASPGGNGTGAMSREGAIAAKQAFKNDTAKVNRFLSGDTAAVNEMRGLDRIISGDFETVI